MRIRGGGGSISWLDKPANLTLKRPEDDYHPNYIPRRGTKLLQLVEKGHKKTRPWQAGFRLEKRLLKKGRQKKQEIL